MATRFADADVPRSFFHRRAWSAMPVAIYIFSLCTFAFGLSEFVVAGLVTAIASDLQTQIAAAGGAIAAYAFGAAIGAPFITALLSHWKARQVLMLAMAVLTVGSVLMSLSPNLALLLAIRFLVGLFHGVFMAVASDAATELVPPQQAGRALSVVWIGLTLALALGVPLGTFLGSMWSWRGVFLSVALLGMAGMLGLMRFMPQAAHKEGGTPVRAWASIQAIAHPQLLMAAGIGVLVSMATFSFFTFVSPYLLQITQVGTQWLSVGMLLFGLCSIAGNLLGGHLADAMDAGHAILAALLGLALNLAGLYGASSHPLLMMALIGMLGVFFFAIVTMLTLRLLQLARHHVPASTAVAAGLNIASFNLGTALGGGLGSITIAWGGLSYVPLTGTLAALAALALAWRQTRQIASPVATAH